MRVDLLEYELPPELIAQRPPEARDGGRLLVVEPRGASDVALEDSTVGELAAHLPRGPNGEPPLLVVNDTRVLPARLIARKPETGGKVEIFLVRREGPGGYDVPAGVTGEPVRVEGEVWRALGRASKPLRFDRDLEVGDHLSLRILGRAEDDGLLRVLLMSPRPVSDAIQDYGHIPLPPYIKRADEPLDAERYQTVFARASGAVAAPTSALHLSKALLGRLAMAGADLATITLHIGLGTFQPVQVADLDAHPMHEEEFEVPKAAARAIVRAKAERRPVVAVGTTVVRALEAAARIAESAGGDLIAACRGETKLMLQPGERLRVVDALFTNFHLPRSTLLALVAAVTGVPNLLAAYAHAVERRYRFYSYGDAMLIRHVLPAPIAAESVALAAATRAARAELAQQATASTLDPAPTGSATDPQRAPSAAD